MTHDERLQLADELLRLAADARTALVSLSPEFLASDEIRDRQLVVVRAVFKKIVDRANELAIEGGSER